MSKVSLFSELTASPDRTETERNFCRLEEDSLLHVLPQPVRSVSPPLIISLSPKLPVAMETRMKAAEKAIVLREKRKKEKRKKAKDCDELYKKLRFKPTSVTVTPNVYKKQTPVAQVGASQYDMDNFMNQSKLARELLRINVSQSSVSMVIDPRSSKNEAVIRKKIKSTRIKKNPTFCIW